MGDYNWWLHILWILTNIMTCIHHYSIIQNSFIDLKILCAPPIYVPSNLRKPLIFLLSSSFCLFQNVIELALDSYVGFSDWLISLNDMHWIYPHAFVWLDSSFLYFFLFNLFFLFVVNFVIHWNETAIGLHVFPIPIPPPTSLSTHSP